MWHSGGSRKAVLNLGYTDPPPQGGPEKDFCGSTEQQKDWLDEKNLSTIWALYCFILNEGSTAVFRPERGPK